MFSWVSGHLIKSDSEFFFPVAIMVILGKGGQFVVYLERKVY